jgi:hypothetical protein
LFIKENQVGIDFLDPNAANNAQQFYQTVPRANARRNS